MLKILYQETFCGNRAYNQDALLIKEFCNGDMLLAVADGMGRGALGAELAQETMNMLKTLLKDPVKYPGSSLKEIIPYINNTLKDILTIYDLKTRKEIKIQKGGTTLCLVYYSNAKKQITYLNIGDSRVSLCGKKRLINLSIDQNKYEKKQMNEEHPKQDDKRIVSIILGGSSDMEIEEVLENKQWSAIGQKILSYPEDTIILSTDGFHDYIDQNLFCDDFHKSFTSIFNKVKQVSQDNITIIVAKSIS